MIPVTYPSSVSTSKESQMVVFALSSVAGLQRWTDYIPVKYQSTGSDVPNSFNTNGYIACDFITNLTGKQAWVDYVPVFVDNLATTAWQVSDTGFIPFNTLAGGGTYVSLDLNFLNTTALDSRITFSRGTNATLTGSNGLIQYAPHNLLTNSEDFEAAAWGALSGALVVTANTVTSPDGSQTADTITLSNSFRIQQVTTSIGTTYTLSIWMRSASGTPVVGLTEANGSGNTDVTISTAWQRYTFTFTAISTVSYVGLDQRPASRTKSGDIYVWGAQLNVGALQTYYPTTPKNLLGFTQEPENAAWTKSNSYVQQNLLTWSQDFDNAAWLKNDVTVSANTTVAPDGSTTGDSVVEAATTAIHRTQQTFTATLNQSVTTSVYARANGLRRLYINAIAIANAGALFDLTGAGSVVATAGTAVNLAARITSVGNSWYRCELTGTGTAVAGNAFFQINRSTSSTASDDTYLGDGTSGLILWGAQLVQGSTAGDYTQTTSAAAPTRYLNFDGTLTGRKLVEDTANTVHRAVQTFTVVSGTPYTLSVYAKAAERTFITLQLSLGFAGTPFAFFNLSNGTIGTTSGSPSATITSVGGGWYRCTVTAVANSTGAGAQPYVYLASADGVTTYTGDGTSGIYVSDFQLSNSASVDPYVYNPQAAAASAAYYGPRFDYDPVTLAPRGLLIEEQRTNLLTYSEQFDNAAWTKSNVTVTANSTVAPDGTTTADTFVESTDAVPAAHFIFQSPTLAAGQSYTFTCYAKAISSTRLFQLFVRDSASTVFASSIFNLTTGTIPFVGAGTSSITNVGNGWYRLTVTGTAGAAGVGLLLLSSKDLSGLDYIGNGSSVAFIWGAQLEAGSFATSYIPTVASQVTRNADSASMLGDNFYTWYNPNQGTVSAEASIAQLPTASTVLAEIGDGTNANRVVLFRNGNSTIASEYVFAGGVGQAALDVTNVFNVNAVGKFVGAYALNDFRAAGNGVLSPSDTSGTLPVVSRLYIGNSIGSVSYWSGWIRSIRYYNTRLPDSTLQALTT